MLGERNGRAEASARRVYVQPLGAGLSPAQEPFVPGGIETVGLQRIVPDTICFMNDWGDGVRLPLIPPQIIDDITYRRPFSLFGW